MLSLTARGPLRPLFFASRAYEGVQAQGELSTLGASVKSASWNSTRALLARVFGAELVFGELALESVNGALKDGGA